jgi:hypothetical protein
MVEFSDYALWKMSQRGIERDDVRLVLADPECQFPSRELPLRHIYRRHIGGRLIYVVVEPFDHRQVVTVFLPPRQNRRS